MWCHHDRGNKDLKSCMTKSMTELAPQARDEELNSSEVTQKVNSPLK
jgi:hypothetical protein